MYLNLTRERPEFGRRILIWVIVSLIALMLWLLYGLNRPTPAQGQESSQLQQVESGQNVAVADASQDSLGQPRTNPVVIELFYRSDSEQSRNAKKYLEEFRTSHSGIEIKTYDVLADKQQLARLWQLSKRFGRDKAGVPSFYFFDSLKVGFVSPETSGPQFEELFTIKAYIRPGCRHCQDGKLFLDAMAQRWPAFKVQYFDVVNDINALNEMQRLATQFRVLVPSFPFIKVAGRVVVGFQSAEITGGKIESLFQDRSVNFPKLEQTGDQADEKSDKGRGGVNSEQSPSKTPKSDNSELGSGQSSIIQGLEFSPIQLISLISRSGEHNQKQDSEPQELPENIELPDDVELPADVELPEEATDSPIIADKMIGAGQADSIETAWFGRLSVSQLGLPLFTFLIGLIDGFNPCAMWVLVFLLSVLVSIKERKKILLVAGTFIVVSGLAYFLFMTAWFNVFQLIGLLRTVQIGLGVVAIVFGLINVKDFFAFHKGLTLSIPDSAKPGIYRRVRNIVTTNQMTTALSGAIALAVVVNIVELLCTAGLPALYTQILTMHELPLWKNYAYLGLYISAYMLDDAILVGIVVITLSNRRLQENEGRWLKLLSGLIILLLGVVMIFWPDALV